jgi:hypothetical protein
MRKVSSFIEETTPPPGYRWYLTILLCCCSQIEFFDRDSLGGDKATMTLAEYPETMSKKVTLLKYFKNYMTQHLLTVS